MEKIRIGDVLKQAGYLTDEQIQQALAYQKEHPGERLGEIVVKFGLVTKQQMMEALSRRLGLQFVDITDMRVDAEAVAKIPKPVAEKYMLVALQARGSELTVAMYDPLNYYAIEDVRQITQMNIKIVLDVDEHIRKVIDRYYAEVGTREAFKKAHQAIPEAEVEELETLEDTGEEAPIVKALNSLLVHGYNMGASDVHIEPFEDKIVVRMRVDGVMIEVAELSPTLLLSLIARIKILSDMDIAERRLPQDGHFRNTVEGIDMNARVSVIPTVFGEKAVIRFLFTNVVIDNASRFGMNEKNYEKFRRMMDTPHGIVYITGPTGSGKTTTLYMVLEQMGSRAINISTIEDPVERNLAGINQVQVNNVAGLSFEAGLRSLLRQDPDVIMVGETRDSETASISVRAAITGHLVFSTLHTNDAVSSIVRLRDMGVPSYLIANSLVGLVAQRLMRKVCPDCAEEYRASEAECALLGVESAQLRRGRGCNKCNNTGYRGRTAIHEVVEIDKSVRRLIAAGKEAEDVVAHIRREQDFKTLYDAARDMVLEGITTIEEFNKVAYYAD
ncbi:MAG: ATPase, T2SS/T4P/T4SS family [Bacillota bacterium]|nr:ATPase, T2SS/T4P/T4SS family [Bacillota bacterium]